VKEIIFKNTQLTKGKEVPLIEFLAWSTSYIASQFKKKKKTEGFVWFSYFAVSLPLSLINDDLFNGSLADGLCRQHQSGIS
jgi:hypothetical protein